MCSRCKGEFGWCSCCLCKGDAIMRGCGVMFVPEPGLTDPAFCDACAEKRDALDRPKYLVCYGVYEQQRADFDSFDEALAFYRQRWADRLSWETCSLLGPHFDGESDGLSEDEREAVRCG